MTIRKLIVILVLHTLYSFVENELDYRPLRLVVSGTAGTGKSYFMPSEASAAIVWKE